MKSPVEYRSSDGNKGSGLIPYTLPTRRKEAGVHCIPRDRLQLLVMSGAAQVSRTDGDHALFPEYLQGLERISQFFLRACHGFPAFVPYPP